MNNSILSPWLDEKILKGEAILFLGAGASKGACGPHGEKPLDGDKLRDVLSDRFLGGALKDKPLAQVAEYAKSESSLADVQAVINELFSPLEPADFHLLIPSFRWHAIVTTNYDFIVERAYAKNDNPLQELAPIIRDGDRITEKLRNPSAVPYLKLHGCLSARTDPSLPLILASAEYAKHRHGRDRLFTYFQDWARENPVIFCGYDVADPNIQQILFDLSDLGINRPEYAIVRPGLTEFDIRYWQSRRFVPSKTTFEEFLRRLDSHLPQHARVVSTLKKRDASSIQGWIQRGHPTDQLLLYVDQVLEHVRGGMPYKAVSPSDFYRGEAYTWSPIIQDLDVRRRITDDILIEAVLDMPERSIPRVYLVKGHAGSGKSVTLRRIAWDAATEHGRLVFWLRAGGYLRHDLIRELYGLTGERIFVVIEDAIPHLDDLVVLVRQAERDQLPVTLILAARSNEWNVVSGDLDLHVTKDYELRDLSHSEIDNLLAKLVSTHCLGALESLAEEERRNFFVLSAERQLLVALHEATAGRTFEEIVVDEYSKVVPREAQTLYLDVCTLHRFKVGVRAGLISRVSEVTFTYFQDRLFKPLEHLVQAHFDPSTRDYAYQTRHSVIADLVFRHVLSDQEKRADQIIRIVRSMNVDFESDRIAFEQLIRGRDLAELFSDRVMADRILEAALMAHASISHVEHQRAVFELNHPGGNTTRALKAIEKAQQHADSPRRAIVHTKAMVLRRMALESTSVLEREKLRSDAKSILKAQIKKGVTSHPFHTYGQIVLDELDERLNSPTANASEEGLSDRILAELIAEAEEVIACGLQRFPGESYLLDLEAKLANYLNDTPRALTALEKAFESNPGNGYVAVRLASRYGKEEERGKARNVLVRCLEHNPNSRIVHLQLAKSFIDEDAQANSDNIRSHLRSSFTDGDTNYDAQFWYARHEFLYGDQTRSAQTFARLSKAKVSPEARNRARAPICSDRVGKRRFEAFVTNVHDSFCFVRVPDLNAEVFVHHSAFEEKEWQSIRPNQIVFLTVAFNFRGAIGVDASSTR